MKRDERGGMESEERGGCAEREEEMVKVMMMSRRVVAACAFGAVAMVVASPYRADAKQGIDLNKRGASGAKKADTKYAFRTVPLTDYTRDERTGLLFYDIAEGFGRELTVGDTATVHFDCRFRGIDAVSSRQAALLGGNRTIAQPAVVKVGEKPVKGRKGGGRRDDLLEKSGGLYTGSKGPVSHDALKLRISM